MSKSELTKTPSKVTDVDTTQAINDALALQIVSIQLPASTIERFKAIAQGEGINYKALMRNVLLCFGDQHELKHVWRDMSCAPKDASIVRLLVNFEEGSFEDDTSPVATIGTNHFSNTGVDEWLFAGWSWTHDCFTQGIGTPIGWLPMLDTPALQTEPIGKMAVPSNLETQLQLAAVLAQRGGTLPEWWPAAVQADKGPCATCGVPYARHGSYPTCSTHPHVPYQAASPALQTEPKEQEFTTPWPALNDLMQETYWMGKGPNNHDTVMAWSNALDRVLEERVPPTLQAEPSAYLLTRSSGFAWAAMPSEITPETRAAHAADGVRIQPLTFAAPVEQASIEADGIPKDFLTHRGAWRTAIAELAEKDDSGYWPHELRAFDRAYEALTSPTLQAEPTTPVAAQPAVAIPMQPLVTDKHGVLRFKENRIVSALLEHSRKHGYGLNEVAHGNFTPEEHMQVAQLIGYSLDGYGTLSYVTDESYDRAALAAPSEATAVEPADEYDCMKAQKDKIVLRDRLKHCTCDECGKKKSDGWALYCVECSGKFYAPAATTSPLNDRQISFGLNSNLEDPSDDEAHGFEVGVRFAEWMHRNAIATMAAEPVAPQASVVPGGPVYAVVKDGERIAISSLRANADHAAREVGNAEVIPCILVAEPVEGAALALPAALTDAQIAAAVNRFLGWRLPDDFCPDAGISFKRIYNEKSPFGPSTHQPIGTNLLTADQARAMFVYALNADHTKSKE